MIQSTKFMNTSTLQIVLTGIVTTSLALVAVSTIAVGVSYLAVGMLLAVAAVDYRQVPKYYTVR